MKKHNIIDEALDYKEYDLALHKENAERDYIETPLAVLKYISKLEAFIKEEKEKKEYLDSVYQKGLEFWSEHLPEEIAVGVLNTTSPKNNSNGTI